MHRLSTVMEVASSNPVTFFFVFVFVFRFYILMNQFICLFIDIIHYHFQTILVAEYRFNDIKRY